MSVANVRVGVGTRFLYDGELVEIIEMRYGPAGSDVVVRSTAGKRRVQHVALRELLHSERARIVPDLPGPSADDPQDPASVVLAELTEAQKELVAERAAHVRETLTGYRSGSAELAQPGEPRPQFCPTLPLMSRYEAKATELGVAGCPFGVPQTDTLLCALRSGVPVLRGEVVGPA